MPVVNFPTRFRWTRRVRGTAVLASVAVLAPLYLARPVAADPVADKRAEAARLAREIEAKGTRVAMLAEQVDQARLHADDVRDRLNRVEVDVAAADARAELARQAMRAQAVSVYVRGAQRLSAAGAVDDPTVSAYLGTVTAGEQDVLERMRDARASLDAERERLKVAQRDAADALGQVSASEQGAQDAVQAEQAILDRVQGDLTQMVAEEQQRQAAAAAARAQADLAARGGNRTARADRGSADRNAPAQAAPASEAPVSPGAAGAVDEARRQLGKPYRYGGAGPDSFDCSGLTMWAWGHAGRSLPHSAAAQYNATTRVAIADLQPGDLVFYGKSIYHMGIYVGNGQMIEAPHTGAVVRYASIYRSDLMGAGRP